MQMTEACHLSLRNVGRSQCTGMESAWKPITISSRQRFCFTRRFSIAEMLRGHAYSSNTLSLLIAPPPHNRRCSRTTAMSRRTLSRLRYCDSVYPSELRIAIAPRLNPTPIYTFIRSTRAELSIAKRRHRGSFVLLKLPKTSASLTLQQQAQAGFRIDGRLSCWLNAQPCSNRRA